MTFIKKYKNTLLSLICIILTFLLIYLVIFGSPYFGNSWLVGTTGLILSILGVVFALKSKRLKEPLWASTLLLIIGILVLIFVAFNYVFGMIWFLGALSPACRNSLC